MAWIESHQSLSRHHKTLRASAILKIDKHKFIGHLHELWWWALDNVPSNGWLRDMSDKEIAQAAGWTRNPSNFVSVLIECGGEGTAGFIEVKDGQRYLHDWYDYAGRLQDRRQADRERKRRDIPQNSDGIPMEFPRTQPNPTNNTLPNTILPEEDDRLHPLLYELRRLKNWNGDGDSVWLMEFLEDYPSFSLIHVRACRDRWLPLETGKKPNWRSRLRNWMTKEAEFNKGKETNEKVEDRDDRVDWQ